MSAKEEWKDPLTPKDLSLAEEVIDEQQAEIDELKKEVEELSKHQARLRGWLQKQGE